MAAASGIWVGAEFTTLQSLLDAVKEFEVQNKVTYWRRDTRTLTNARKRGIDVPDNPEIQYYAITFACNFGGRNFKSKSAGLRPNRG